MDIVRGDVSPSADLSAVVVAPHGLPDLRETWDHLARQSVAGRVEVVVVRPAGSAWRLPETHPFAAVREATIESVESIGPANAAGARVASADVVAFVEDHAWPAPDWAAALLRAHRRPWAVVGPGVVCANGSRPIPWADFVVTYGPWALPQEAGRRPFLPGHNSSYKRSVLAGYGERLEEWLSAETAFHLELGAAGYGLWLEPTARIRHLNFDELVPCLRVQFLTGRDFAGARVAGWGPVRRLALAAATPLVPLVRLARCLRHARRIGWPTSRRVAAAAALGACLVADGAGQLVGALAGQGDAGRRLGTYEFGRTRWARPDPEPEER